MQKEYNNQLVIGRNPVLELLKSERQIEKIYIQQGMKGDFEIELRNLLKGKNIPVSHVHPAKLNGITSQNHQGVIAVTSLIEYTALEDLIDKIYFEGEVPCLLFLDSITDIRNVGSIIRSAEVLGAHGIILGSKNTAIINHIAIKVSAGAAFNLPIVKVHSANNAIETLKNSGISIYASTLDCRKNLSEINFNNPFCVILGSEDEGITPHMLKISDDEFKIPQFGKTESLNVAVSAGIILYEAVRQRR
ncbi:MAG: 23S rRNA (guanosine(2251)-2'-O)-methyltransferase RlmB [Saprospiraceae bacterium]|nr:23S rRNA (guanosine(2251)-2'-O)-methyltransferase RlmB [Saprospiraceae bacterium]